MALNLGLIPFSPEHSQNRALQAPPRERQTRSGSTGILRSVVDGGASGARPAQSLASTAASVGATVDEETGPRSRIAEISIRPDTIGPLDVRFLLGASEERLGRSLAASLGSHIVGVGMIALLLSLAPERVYELIEPNRESYGIVWLPDEGLGGGGGGGGNESLELPQQVQLEGSDDTALSVPVQEEPDFVEPEIEPEVLQTQQMNIPALAMASAPTTTAGVLDGLMASAHLSQGSGSGGGGGAGAGTGIGPGQGPGLGPGEGGGVGGGVYRPGSGVKIPQLVREVKPRYTADAMRAKVQGMVWLEVVVRPDGTVGDITVTKSLDTVFGLDEEAIRAAKQWRFVPGTRFGEPVSVLVSIELSFTLR